MPRTYTQALHEPAKSRRTPQRPAATLDIISEPRILCTDLRIVARDVRMTPVPSKQQEPRPFTSDWLTPAEAARYRNVSESCQSKERVRGDGPPFIKIRKRMIRYSRRAIDEWLATKVRRSTSENPPPIKADSTNRSKVAAHERKLQPHETEPA